MSLVSDAIHQLHELFLLYFSKPGDDVSLKGFSAQYRCPNDECKTNNPATRSYGKLKLSCSFDRSVYHCWVCGYSGTLNQLANRYFEREDQKKFRECRAVLHEEGIDGKSSQEREITEAELQAFVPDFEPILSGDSSTNFMDFLKQSAYGYLVSRTISDEQIRFYNIMYSRTGEYRNRIIFPSYSTSGTLNYFVSRSVEGESAYKNPRVSQRNFIFNEYLIDWKKELLIVEGPFDYLRLHGYNRVPLLGSTLNSDALLFQKIIYHRTPVCLCLDPDAKEKAGKLARQLARWSVPVNMAGTELMERIGCKDPGEMDPALFRDILEQPYSSEKLTLIHKRLTDLKCALLTSPIAT